MGRALAGNQARLENEEMKTTTASKIERYHIFQKAQAHESSGDFIRALWAFRRCGAMKSAEEMRRKLQLTCASCSSDEGITLKRHAQPVPHAA